MLRRPTAIALDSSHAFIGAGATVYIFDHRAAEAGKLHFVGKTAQLPGLIAALARMDNLLIVGMNNGLAIVDVNSPSAPHMTGWSRDGSLWWPVMPWSSSPAPKRRYSM
jgi:hypothetical protein